MAVHALADHQGQDANTGVIKDLTDPTNQTLINAVADITRANLQLVMDMTVEKKLRLKK